jgi:hypothetical protein
MSHARRITSTIARNAGPLMHDFAVALITICLLGMALLNRAASFDRLRDPE